MWGHSQSCGCTLCITFSRVFGLVREGTSLPGFVPLASGPLRVLEGELRDTVEFCHRQNRTHPAAEVAPPAPSESPLPPPAAVPPDPEKPDEPDQKKPQESKGSGQEKDSQRKPANPGQHLFPKSKPSSPPEEAKEISKVETKDSPECSVAGEVIEQDEETERPSSSGVRKRSRSRRRRSRTSGGQKEKRRSRSRSRRRRRRGDEEPPISPRGRERRERDRSPKRPRTPDHPPGPRTPPTAPPSPVVRQGRGWVGEIPYSSHPRWSQGTNKGLVKRAKQERYNQRRQGDGRW